MELIYAYIDSYRTFENQSISFSDKFKVKYNDAEKNLSITRNETYFDIYPKNIVGISAIVGKNATGKTSLLSLIGKKVDDRHSANEIWKAKYEDPFRKLSFESISVSEGLDSIEYENVYFLLYFYGKNSAGEDLFIFETNHPKQFISVFKNHEDLTYENSNYGSRLDYFRGKGWFCGGFKIVDSENIYCDDIQMFKVDGVNIQENASIISFEKTNYSTMVARAITGEEESRIAVRRINVPLENIYYYQKLNFLIEQMKIDTDQKTMYSDDEYYLQVKFKESYISLPDNEALDSSAVVNDYRDFQIREFALEEKIILAFLYGFTCYIFTSLIYNTGPVLDRQRSIISELIEVPSEISSYKDIKALYHKKIDIIFQTIKNSDFSLTEFLKVEAALEDFLYNASACNITYKYLKNDLTLRVKQDSQLERVKSFFDEFIDEEAEKNFQKRDSVLYGFLLSTKILHLSEGESENLSLFTSIYEQVRLMHVKKEKYILLFDEIERSMHPEMCRRLITDLIRFLESYHDQEFQIIIGSHSPFIISDIRKENVICLSRQGEKSAVEIPKFNTLGQNIHTILKGQFFLDSTFGEYSTELMNLIVESLDVRDTESIEKKINDFLGIADKDYGKRKILSKKEALEFLEEAISSIGEPLIRTQLQEMYFKKKDSILTIEEKIAYHENQLDKLRAEEGAQ